MTDDADEELMARLRAIAATVAAPPAHVEEAARAAFSTRHLDELASLLMDSETGTPVLARGEPGQVRLLSFAAGEVSVELQVTSTGATVSIRGLVQGASGSVTIETSTARHEVQSDDYGWFTATGVASGMCRLRLQAAHGTTVTTEWVDL